MLSITLDPATERRLADLAKQTGRSVSEHARELIEANIDDLEDRYVAEKRLEERKPAMTSNDVRRALGLDD